MMFMFVVFTWNGMCIEQTDHDAYVPGVHLNKMCMEQTDHDGCCFLSTAEIK